MLKDSRDGGMMSRWKEEKMKYLRVSARGVTYCSPPENKRKFHASSRSSRCWHLSVKMTGEVKNGQVSSVDPYLQFNMADGHHFENRKIAISQKPFDQF